MGLPDKAARMERWRLERQLHLGTSETVARAVAGDIQASQVMAEPNMPWAMDNGTEDDTYWLQASTPATLTTTMAPHLADGSTSSPHWTAYDSSALHSQSDASPTASPLVSPSASGSTLPSPRLLRSGGAGRGAARGIRPSSVPRNVPHRLSVPASAAASPSSLGAGAGARSDDSGRVRVGVRLRPMTRQERVNQDPDEIPVVEASPETNRILLRRNQWDGESYQFDQAYPAHTSQKRIYEMVAAPVVESVLRGYNGTVMAYGQTGTGKTFTMGLLAPRAFDNVDGVDMDGLERLDGADEASLECGSAGGPGIYGTCEDDEPRHGAGDRGIMVRALERILEGAAASGGDSTVTVSYLQVYLDQVYDLLAGKARATEPLAVAEDYTTGEVHATGARTVDVDTLPQAMKLLREGEANRRVANHLLNASSSRSHVLLSVTVRTQRQVVAAEGAGDGGEPGAGVTGVPASEDGQLARGSGGAVGISVLKGKLLLVDLAGSERAGKSGAEGQTFEELKAINLHLHALGKCISALSSHTPTHVPYRESKLTRLLKDSFGGTAKTSLLVTIGPGRAHHSETAAALAFGQRALKVENTLRIKEDLDFKLSTRKLQVEVDRLTRELESAEEGKRAAERRRGAAAEAAATAACAATSTLMDKLAESRQGHEAAELAARDLRLELALVVENHAALEAAQQTARIAERVELSRRWEEDEAARHEDEEAWRAEVDECRRDRDELVRAVVDERARWDADRSVVEAARAAETAAWEGERAALTAATEAAAAVDVKGRERAAVALAALAAETAWDAERSQLHAVMGVERTQLAAAAQAEGQRARAAAAEDRAAAAEVAGCERAAAAAEAAQLRAAVAAVEADLAHATSSLQHDRAQAREHARAQAVHEWTARLDAAEDARAAAETSAADARSAADDAYATAEDRAAAAVAAATIRMAAAAAAAHDQLAERIEVAEAATAAGAQAAQDAVDARESWSIQLAVLQAKWQQEHDARIVEVAAHRQAWAVEEARLTRAFQDEAKRTARAATLHLDLAREEAVQETIQHMLEASFEPPLARTSSTPASSQGEAGGDAAAAPISSSASSASFSGPVKDQAMVAWKRCMEASGAMDTFDSGGNSSEAG
eukprot:CAMPEP_0181353562 /NCGR_PEP_ID=MMETSP1106-20121128/2898_1 /TAXON_ID=81844 /ORGANISM="Mantoniella antarctica, Strain SL-175" /LENGTH=1124 /DNA_ID=CAMNT_0023466175 /DNA_START=118 /DNA_END=3489 /DNA_ORIENTATION=-